MSENTSENTSRADDRPAEAAQATDVAQATSAEHDHAASAPDTSPAEATRELNAATPDEPPTVPLPLAASDSPEPAATWQLPAGEPPESPAAQPPQDLPLTPERDVWSAPRKDTDAQKNGLNPDSAPQSPRGVRASTLVWGLILLVLGGLLLAVAAGVQVDLVTAVIVLLAGIGVALLITALLPHRKADGQ